MELKDYSETVPIQYEENKAFFMGMEFFVDERVLIPRPETELLVKIAVGECRNYPGGNQLILDMCTGSGAVALGITKLIDNCRVIAADISDDALDVASLNIIRHGERDRIDLIRSDMFSSLSKEYFGQFDCVVSNPPYVSSGDYAVVDAWVKAEPRIALLSGEEGLDHLSIIVVDSLNYLKKGGFLCVEVGYDQGEKVRRLMEGSGYMDVKGHIDVNGYERVVIGRKNG